MQVPVGDIHARPHSQHLPTIVRPHPPLLQRLNRLKGADYSSWSGSAWTTTLAFDLAGINYDPAGNLTALQRYRETATLI
ncbi:MAG TPA: hypothetical protein VJS20_12670, partial [Gemmatimonadales bacterium]|nr:hypothetical protein [Gemmatimonadales bacterium]